MLCQDNIDEYFYLKSKGFTVKFLDDMSGFWFSKKVKTKYFGKVVVNCEDFQNEGRISVSTNKKMDHYDYGSIDIINYKYSRKNLKGIIKMLKNK